MLRQGGNAVDAAVATGFAMAVTYPRAGNIGGGGFMVIHSAERHQDFAIDYRETAPAATTRDIFLGPDGKPDNAKSRGSALGIGVPGTVAGLTLALEKYGSGKFSLAELLKPAIDLARDGIAVADDIADTLPDEYRWLSRWPASAKLFSRADGNSLREGDMLVQTDLAATLSAIAEQGPRGFYRPTRCARRAFPNMPTRWGIRSPSWTRTVSRPTGSIPRSSRRSPCRNSSFGPTECPGKGWPDG